MSLFCHLYYHLYYRISIAEFLQCKYKEIPVKTIPSFSQIDLLSVKHVSSMKAPGMYYYSNIAKKTYRLSFFFFCGLVAGFGN